MHTSVKQENQDQIISSYNKVLLEECSIFVADLGFPRGGTNPEMGAPTYFFGDFFRKLHEIEKNWTQKGCMSLAPP